MLSCEQRAYAVCRDNDAGSCTWRRSRASTARDCGVVGYTGVVCREMLELLFGGVISRLGMRELEWCCGRDGLR